MNVGLPGTGIGGLFYLCLVGLMPLHELWKLARGNSSRRRWTRVGLHFSIAGGIVAALWAESWLLQRLLAALAGQPSAMGRFLQEQLSRGHVLPEAGRIVAIGSVATLLGVLLMAQLAEPLLAQRDRLRRRVATLRELARERAS